MAQADSILATVYTGLRIVGPEAAGLVTEIEQATAWTLQKNGDGDVWRTGASKTPQGWQSVARSETARVFASKKLTTLDTVKTGHVAFAHWKTARFDPSDFAALRGGAGGPSVAGAIMAHELVEQYLLQTNGKENDTFDDYLQAHEAALTSEANILGSPREPGGDGLRLIKEPGGGTVGADFWILWQNGLRLTYSTAFNPDQPTITNVVLTWP